MPSNANQEAERLISAGQPDAARLLLLQTVGQMPAGWQPCQEDESCLRIAFWNTEELIAFISAVQSSLQKDVLQVLPSYSLAWYQLAFLAVGRGDFAEALDCLDEGIRLESNHPELWCEKGYVLSRLGRHKEALSCYQMAETARPWAPASQRARALRGQGSVLIDLQDLDGAEIAFYGSLRLEPGNELTQRELAYLASLREQGTQ
jgi:tetratricopeptide (TPR) repeat protein